MASESLGAMFCVLMAFAMPAVAVVGFASSSWEAGATVGGTKHAAVHAWAPDLCEVTRTVTDKYDQVKGEWSYREEPAYPELARCAKPQAEVPSDGGGEVRGTEPLPDPDLREPMVEPDPEPIAAPPLVPPAVPGGVGR